VISISAGNWARQFDKKLTEEDNFFVTAGKTVKSKFMLQVKFFYFFILIIEIKVTALF
jgi:hypothetical protein